jgi:ketosteroid isomerase-like protein
VTADDADDRAAIRELLLRYARGVDSRDVALVASCFTPDAAYRGGLADGTIRDALAALRGAMERYTATRHAIGAQTIELDGDVARSTADCTALHQRADGRRRTVAVRYHDHLVRGPDGWRIVWRQVERLWTRDEEDDDA